MYSGITSGRTLEQIVGSLHGTLELLYARQALYSVYYISGSQACVLAKVVLKSLIGFWNHISGNVANLLEFTVNFQDIVLNI